MQLPVAQLAVPFAMLQEIPQPPQLVFVVVDVSQPSASPDAVEQSANPDEQADLGMTQLPPLHETALPLPTCGSTVQS